MSVGRRELLVTVVGLACASVTAAPAATAAAAGSGVTWSGVQADRRAQGGAARPNSDTFSSPGPRSGVLARIAVGVDRIGQPPAAGVARSVDGAIGVVQDGVARDVDPTSGAITTASTPVGTQLAVWGPAGDRVMAQLPGDPSPGVVVTDEDGHSNRVVLPPEFGSARPLQQVSWSPFGDSATAATVDASALNLGVNPSALGWYFRTGARPLASPVINSYGDLVISTSAGSVGVGPHLSVTPASYPDGREPTRAPFDLVTPAWKSVGGAAVGLAPRGSVGARSKEFLAVPADLGSRGRQLFVDEANSTGFVGVADLGAICPEMQQVAFAPGHSRLAYLEAAGPSGSECSRTRLWVLDAVDGSYAAGRARLLADSGGGSAFLGLSWKATTPIALAGRIGGRDRIATAVASSRVFFAQGQARTAVVVGSAAAPDALAATPLAGRLGGPLLLTGAERLDPRVSAELARSLPRGATVHVVGGRSAVGRGVAADLQSRGYVVNRLAGADRYATAVAVATYLDTVAPQGNVFPQNPVFVTDGQDFPDALVAGPAASHVFGTLVLSKGANLPASTERYLSAATTDPTRDRVVNSVGRSAEQAVAKEPTLSDRNDPVTGRDRYDTAAMVAQRYFFAPSVAGIVDGLAWPDAASGGAAMAHLGMPLLLVRGGTAPQATRDWWSLTRSSTDAVIAFGSASVVPERAIRIGQQLAGRQTALWGPDLLASQR